MPRSTHRRTAAVALSVLLLAAVPSFAAPSARVEKGSGISAPEALFQNLWQWLEGLWTAGASAEDGDAGARIDGNGVAELAGARIDGNGDAGARIDGNGER